MFAVLAHSHKGWLALVRERRQAILWSLAGILFRKWRADLSLGRLGPTANIGREDFHHWAAHNCPKRPGNPCCPGKTLLGNPRSPLRDRTMGEAIGYKSNSLRHNWPSSLAVFQLLLALLSLACPAWSPSPSDLASLTDSRLPDPAFWPCFRLILPPAAAYCSPSTVRITTAIPQQPAATLHPILPTAPPPT